MSDKVVELTHKGADSRGDMQHLPRFYGVMVWKLSLHEIMKYLGCVPMSLGNIGSGEYRVEPSACEEVVWWLQLVRPGFLTKLSISHHCDPLNEAGFIKLVLFVVSIRTSLYFIFIF